jgi:hypothetical protein
MSYELRKILGNRYVMLLLALAVAVNAALFYRRCTEDLGGFTRADVRAEYAHLDTLEQEYDALLNGIYGEDVGITQVPDEDLRRCALLSTVRDEVETTKNYPEYLRGLCAETEAKLRLGLFSADPFAERTLEKGLAAYSALLGVRLEPSFPDGVEVLLDWRLTDLLLLLFAAVSGLVLLTGERSAGLMVLLRPTRRGHGALYWRKAAAMLATVLAGVVLLYGANLAVSAAVLGLGDPARPIQTIPSMQSCPVPLTVFGWLLCFVGEKLLWGWAVGALFFLLCTTTGRAWAAFLLAGGGAGLALLLGSRGSLWPRLLSLSRAAEVEESWRGCIYLNFFGLPLRQTALLPAMLLLLTVGGCLGGAVVSSRCASAGACRCRACGTRCCWPMRRGSSCSRAGRCWCLRCLCWCRSGAIAISGPISMRTNGSTAPIPKSWQASRRRKRTLILPRRRPALRSCRTSLRTMPASRRATRMRCSSWRATFSRPCGRRTALSRQSSSMSSCSRGSLMSMRRAITSC